MSALLELQRDFRRALLEEDEAAIAGLVREDGIAPAARLAVYRNTIMLSLTDALKEIFPATCRVVDERFFAYAARSFLAAHPPEEACLGRYGARLPDFLAKFPPAAHLLYLPDLARLEWLMHCAAEAATLPPLGPKAIAGIAPEETPRLRFRLQPALGHLDSPWPVDRIWRANRAETSDDAAEEIDLDSGGVGLEIGRTGEIVTMRPLDAPALAFRRALAAGVTLEAAAEAAFAIASDFDLAAALAALFRDGLVVGVVNPEKTHGSRRAACRPRSSP
jgi:hypothetical protein